MRTDDRDKELEILGYREGTSQSIFGAFNEFRFDFCCSREIGSWGWSIPVLSLGIRMYPHKDWEVYHGRVQMLVLDGARVRLSNRLGNGL